MELSSEELRMCQPRQAGKLTLEFQHIKNVLVHPPKNHMENDVMFYVNMHMHTLLFILIAHFFCYILVIHVSPLNLYSWILSEFAEY